MDDMKTLEALNIGLMTEEEIRIPAENITGLIIEDIRDRYEMVGMNQRVRKEAESDQFHIAIRNFENSTSTYYVKENEELSEEDYVAQRLIDYGRDVAYLTLEYTDNKRVEIAVTWEADDLDPDNGSHKRQYALIDEERTHNGEPEFAIGQTNRTIRSNQ